MAWKTVGTRYLMPAEVDYVTYTNEDLGFIADLTVATKNYYTFQMPFPRSFDEYEESMVVWKIQFGYRTQGYLAEDLGQQIQVLASFYQTPPVVETWDGLLSDDDDEWWKGIFADIGRVGFRKFHPLGAAIVGGEQYDTDNVQEIEWFPELPLDLKRPLTLHFINSTTDIVFATGADEATKLDFSTYEKVYMRVWYTKRELTSAEKDARRAMQDRWMRRES